MKKKILLCGALSVLLFSVSSTSQAAGFYPWKWGHGVARTRDLTIGLQHLTALNNARIQYNNENSITGVTFLAGPNNANPPFAEAIALAPLFLSPSNVIGIAIPVNMAGLQCADTTTLLLNGNCPTGTLIDFAAVFINNDVNSQAATLTPVQKQWFAIHEIGHVLGMAHDACNIFGFSPRSVMAPKIDGSGCVPLQLTIQPIDRIILDIIYP